ncbi:hypothetical protein [Marinicella rhabdoformis]|uniref:hypothetical protein n=1 Tax=Marinicella rhabdoformis TaxID=2580566 RepID=UPI0012AEDF75|nr:hypothetical protein [Marinicella rhabdoformis]
MKLLIKIIGIALLFLLVDVAYGQYAMKKQSISNGGGKLSGGRFELTSTIGQHDSSKELSNGAYSLNGGFWHENTDLIYQDEFE